MNLIDEEKILDRACRSILLGAKEFIYTIRENKSVPHFFEKVEKELRQQRAFRIHQYKKVKEGLAHVARPQTLIISESEFFSLRPKAREVKESFTEFLKYQELFPGREFLEKNFSLCFKKHHLLRECLEVYLYLENNRDLVHGLLSRQIPHAQSTKLIGAEGLLLSLYAHKKGKGECGWKDFFYDYGILDRSPEFRIYAPVCNWRGSSLEEFHGIISEELVPQFSFPEISSTLVVENLESFLSLVPQSKNTLLVWGGGWKCLQLLELKRFLPGEILYWGDIDKEGIEIASQFCESMGARPLLMDIKTLNTYEHLAQIVEYQKNPRKITLLEEVYQEVCRRQIRIEQEKIQINITNIIL